MGERETKSRWCSKTEMYLLERCGRWRFQWNHWKMHGKSWRCWWRRLCFVNWGRPSVPASCWKQSENQRIQQIPKTKHSCIVEAHESTRQRLESSVPKIMMITSQAKDTNSMTHYNLIHKFIPMPQAMKVPDARAPVDKEWKKPETHPACKKEVLLGAQRYEKKVELEPILKCEGRVVPRGDIVKDDSGAHAVFTEQGSSASQMTAAKK